MAKTGPLPGVTRGVSGFKVSSDPLAFLVDTPGVMLPRIDNLEVGLKLALTGMDLCPILLCLSLMATSMIDKMFQAQSKNQWWGRKCLLTFYSIR